MQIAAVDVDALEPGDVAVHVDVLGRVVVVIPDAAADALRRVSAVGWAELPGVDYGESDRYPVGSRVHPTATALLGAALGTRQLVFVRRAGTARRRAAAVGRVSRRDGHHVHGQRGCPSSR